MISEDVGVTARIPDICQFCQKYNLKSREAQFKWDLPKEHLSTNSSSLLIYIGLILNFFKQKN